MSLEDVHSLEQALPEVNISRWPATVPVAGAMYTKYEKVAKNNYFAGFLLPDWGRGQASRE